MLNVKFFLKYGTRLCRQESCRREDGSQDGLRKTRTVVTVTGVGTGKQERRRGGMGFQIYLDRVVIYLRVLEKKRDWFLIPSSVNFLLPPPERLSFRVGQLTKELLQAVTLVFL